MDDHAPEVTPAQQLPVLYRTVLDLVAGLECAGERRAAYDLRCRAIRSYSTRWDEGGRRTMYRLIREGETRLAAIARLRPVLPVAAADAAPAPAPQQAPAAGSAAA